MVSARIPHRSSSSQHDPILYIAASVWSFWMISCHSIHTMFNTSLSTGNSPIVAEESQSVTPRLKKQGDGFKWHRAASDAISNQLIPVKSPWEDSCKAAHNVPDMTEHCIFVPKLPSPAFDAIILHREAPDLPAGLTFTVQSIAGRLQSWHWTARIDVRLQYRFGGPWHSPPTNSRIHSGSEVRMFDWLESFIRGRSQSVTFVGGTVRSQWRAITTGVLTGISPRTTPVSPIYSRCTLDHWWSWCWGSAVCWWHPGTSNIAKHSNYTAVWAFTTDYKLFLRSLRLGVYSQIRQLLNDWTCSKTQYICVIRHRSFNALQRSYDQTGTATTIPEVVFHYGVVDLGVHSSTRKLADGFARLVAWFVCVFTTVPDTNNTPVDSSDSMLHELSRPDSFIVTSRRLAAHSDWSGVDVCHRQIEFSESLNTAARLHSSNPEIPSNVRVWSQGQGLPTIRSASSTTGEIQVHCCSTRTPSIHRAPSYLQRTLSSCLYSAWTMSLVIGWTILPGTSTTVGLSDATKRIFCCGTKCLDMNCPTSDTHRNMFEQ